MNVEERVAGGWKIFEWVCQELEMDYPEARVHLRKNLTPVRLRMVVDNDK